MEILVHSFLWLIGFILYSVLAVGVSFVITWLLYKTVSRVYGEYIFEGAGCFYFFIVSWFVCFIVVKDLMHNPIWGWVLGIWTIPTGILIELIRKENTPKSLEAFEYDYGDV